MTQSQQKEEHMVEQGEADGAWTYGLVRTQLDIMLRPDVFRLCVVDGQPVPSKLRSLATFVLKLAEVLDEVPSPPSPAPAGQDETE
jgi:hypothetical protein